MTDIEKLKVLFHVANINKCGIVSPGLMWFNENSLDIDYDLGYITATQNLNCIIGDWERDKISFLHALEIAMNRTDDSADQLMDSHCRRSTWFSLPSSERLEWLFNEYKQLIET